MHRALFLEEILHVIFHHCYPQPRLWSSFDGGDSATDLVALASTCQLFKDPALDVLWRELQDITPLARCLPEVCISKGLEHGRQTYSFKRQLKEAEREIVQRYTCRVRVLSIANPYCLDLECLEDLCLPSATDPLFPNIRRLNFYIADHSLPLLYHIISPELQSLQLYIAVSSISSCEGLIRSLGPTCPGMKVIDISSSCALAGLDEIMTRHIRGWTYLREVECSQISLDIDALLHLSRTPRLTALSFMLSHKLIDQVTSSNHLLVFSALQRLKINIGSIVPISELFAHMRLPAITSISTFFRDTSPPRDVIKSFLMALRNAYTVQETGRMHLSVYHFTILDRDIRSSELPTLTLSDIHYFTAINLTSIHLNLNWIVDIKDGDLLEMANMCQRLITLNINDEYGWKAAGITLDGLAQFLRRCPLIQWICIVVDTRGYTSLPPTGSIHPIPQLIGMNLADSIIHGDSVQALATFFADSFPQLIDGPPFHFKSWAAFAMRRRYPDWEVYMKRWQEVLSLAKQRLLERTREPVGVVEPENC